VTYEVISSMVNEKRWNRFLRISKTRKMFRFFTSNVETMEKRKPMMQDILSYKHVVQ
jgi:hypothetical protein